MSEEKLSKGQQTAQKILEAAARCISKVGIEKTSVTNIAKEAELKRSLIAYHFPKKGEILYQVVEMIIQNFRDYLRQNLEGLSGRRAIERLFTGYLEYFKHYPHYFHVLLHFYYLASIEPRARDLNTQNTQFSLLRLANHLQELMQEEDIEIPRERIKSFAWGLHMWITGTVMNDNCVNHPGPGLATEAISLLRREIDLLTHEFKKS